VETYYWDADGDGLGSGEPREWCDATVEEGWVLNSNDQDDDCFSNFHDCFGVCDGSAVVDECGVCGGDGIADGTCNCAGNVNDACGVCEGDGVQQDCGCGSPGEFGLPDGACDCDGNVDLGCGCGEPANAGCGCGEPANAGCGCGYDGPVSCNNDGNDNTCTATGKTYCLNDFGGDSVCYPVNECGVCTEALEHGYSCEQDCFGDWGGYAELDDCNVCGGDNTVFPDGSSCIGCTDPSACNYDESAGTPCISFVSGGPMGSGDYVENACCEYPVVHASTGSTPWPPMSKSIIESNNNMNISTIHDCNHNCCTSELTDPYCGTGTCCEIIVEEDCNGICTGTALEDECGVCEGDGSDVDVCGVCFGNNTCGGGMNISTGVCSAGWDGDHFGCDGVCYSGLVDDTCGVCDGDNTVFPDGSSCVGCMDESACNYDENALIDSENCLYYDCAGVCGGSNVLDECEVCGGDNSSCADCAGTPNGYAILSSGCNICIGGDSGIPILEMTDENIAVYNCDYLTYLGSSDELTQVYVTWNETYERLCMVMTSDRGCDGVCGSGLVVSNCGICDGDDNVPTEGWCDCTGTPFGEAVPDDCGDCNGGNDVKDCLGNCPDCENDGSCLGSGYLGPSGAGVDCNGVCDGGAIIDDCDVCSGGTTSLTPNIITDAGTFDCSGPNLDCDCVCTNNDENDNDACGDSGFGHILLNTDCGRDQCGECNGDGQSCVGCVPSGEELMVSTSIPYFDDSGSTGLSSHAAAGVCNFQKKSNFQNCRNPGDPPIDVGDYDSGVPCIIGDETNSQCVLKTLHYYDADEDGLGCNFWCSNSLLEGDLTCDGIGFVNPKYYCTTDDFPIGYEYSNWELTFLAPIGYAIYSDPSDFETNGYECICQDDYIVDDCGVCVNPVGVDDDAPNASCSTCITSGAVNYDDSGYVDCNGNLNGSNESCCEFPTLSVSIDGIAGLENLVAGNSYNTTIEGTALNYLGLLQLNLLRYNIGAEGWEVADSLGFPNSGTFNFTLPYSYENYGGNNFKLELIYDHGTYRYITSYSGTFSVKKYGCTTPTTNCNYDSTATDYDGDYCAPSLADVDVGGNTDGYDCNGVCEGETIVDNCGSCGGGDFNNDWVDVDTSTGLQCDCTTGISVWDCNGVCGGVWVEDNELTCCDPQSIGCDGICHSQLYDDCAGDCNGDAVVDCAGACNGSSQYWDSTYQYNDGYHNCGCSDSTTVNENGCCDSDDKDCNDICNGTWEDQECGCGPAGEMNMIYIYGESSVICSTECATGTYCDCDGNTADDCGDCNGGITIGDGTTNSACCSNSDCGSVAVDVCTSNQCVCDSGNVDCAGVCDGTAVIDNCGICSGGTTNHTADSDIDCNGCCTAGPSINTYADNQGSDAGGFCTAAGEGDPCPGQTYCATGNKGGRDECGICGNTGTTQYCNDADNDGLGETGTETNYCPSDCSPCVGTALPTTLNDGGDPLWVTDCTDTNIDYYCQSNTIDQCGVCDGDDTTFVSYADDFSGHPSWYSDNGISTSCYDLNSSSCVGCMDGNAPVADDYHSCYIIPSGCTWSGYCGNSSSLNYDSRCNDEGNTCGSCNFVPTIITEAGSLNLNVEENNNATVTFAIEDLSDDISASSYISNSTTAPSDNDDSIVYGAILADGGYIESVSIGDFVGNARILTITPIDYQHGTGASVRITVQNIHGSSTYDYDVDIESVEDQTTSFYLDNDSVSLSPNSSDTLYVLSKDYDGWEGDEVLTSSGTLPTGVSMEIGDIVVDGVDASWEITLTSDCTVTNTGYGFVDFDTPKNTTGDTPKLIITTTNANPSFSGGTASPASINNSYSDNYLLDTDGSSKTFALSIVPEDDSNCTLTYDWQVTSGQDSGYSISSGTQAFTSVTITESGNWQFTCTVSDGVNENSSTTSTLTLNDKTGCDTSNSNYVWSNPFTSTNQTFNIDNTDSQVNVNDSGMCTYTDCKGISGYFVTDFPTLSGDNITCPAPSSCPSVDDVCGTCGDPGDGVFDGGATFHPREYSCSDYYGGATCGTYNDGCGNVDIYCGSCSEPNPECSSGSCGCAAGYDTGCYCGIFKDCNETCGGDAISGCSDINACNYESLTYGNINCDDSSCTYPTDDGVGGYTGNVIGGDSIIYDCDGNCIVETDCAGECGGDAILDECGTCDNDPTNDCIQDCAGTWGGTLELDVCGNCDGDCVDDGNGFVTCYGSANNTVAVADCNGVCGGNAIEDANCGGVCVNGNTNLTCEPDCHGDYYIPQNESSSHKLDDCGTCVVDDGTGCLLSSNPLTAYDAYNMYGDGNSCYNWNTYLNSGGSSVSGCYDCTNTKNGGTQFDWCQVCDGDNILESGNESGTDVDCYGQCLSVNMGSGTATPYGINQVSSGNTDYGTAVLDNCNICTMGQTGFEYNYTDVGCGCGRTPTTHYDDGGDFDDVGCCDTSAEVCLNPNDTRAADCNARIAYCVGLGTPEEVLECSNSLDTIYCKYHITDTIPTNYVAGSCESGDACLCQYDNWDDNGACCLQRHIDNCGDCKNPGTCEDGPITANGSTIYRSACTNYNGNELLCTYAGGTYGDSHCYFISTNSQDEATENCQNECLIDYDSAKDCNGDCDGIAIQNSEGNCGYCIGGNTGNYTTIDITQYDYDGNESTFTYYYPMDCAGRCENHADYISACVDSSSAQNGECGFDECGICEGSDTIDGCTCLEEDGSCNTLAIQQNAGYCGYIDCNGDCFGEAYLNDCNICVGGDTGREEQLNIDGYIVQYGQDCNGVCTNDDGTAYINDCLECVDGDTTLADDYGKDCIGFCLYYTNIGVENACDTGQSWSSGAGSGTGLCVETWVIDDTGDNCCISSLIDNCGVCNGSTFTFTYTDIAGVESDITYTGDILSPGITMIQDSDDDGIGCCSSETNKCLPNMPNPTANLESEKWIFPESISTIPCESGLACDCTSPMIIDECDNCVSESSLDECGFCEQTSVLCVNDYTNPLCEDSTAGYTYGTNGDCNGVDGCPSLGDVTWTAQTNDHCGTCDGVCRADLDLCEINSSGTLTLTSCNTNSCYNRTYTLSGNEPTGYTDTGNCYDCNGTLGGSLLWDDCGVCDGACSGTPGATTDTSDSNSCYVWNGGCYNCAGTFVGRSGLNGFDDCGVCIDGNYAGSLNVTLLDNSVVTYSYQSSTDCADECLGTAYNNGCYCIGVDSSEDTNGLPNPYEYPYGYDCAGNCNGIDWLSEVWVDSDGDGLAYGPSYTLCTDEIEQAYIDNGYDYYIDCTNKDMYNNCLDDLAPECGNDPTGNPYEYDDCKHCNGVGTFSDCQTYGYDFWYYINMCQFDTIDCGPNGDQPCCSLDCECNCIDFNYYENTDATFDECGVCKGNNSSCLGCGNSDFDTYCDFCVPGDEGVYCFDDLTDELAALYESFDAVSNQFIEQANISSAWGQCIHDPISDYTDCINDFIEEGSLDCDSIIGCESSFPDIYIEGGFLDSGGKKASLFGFVVPGIENLSDIAEIGNIFSNVLYDADGNNLDWVNGDMIAKYTGSDGSFQTSIFYTPAGWQLGGQFELTSGMGLMIVTEQENASYIKF